MKQMFYSVQTFYIADTHGLQSLTYILQCSQKFMLRYFVQLILKV